MINLTGSSSISSRLVKINTRRENSFDLLGKGEQQMLGVCAQSGISNGMPCEVVISGSALIFVNGVCKRGDLIRSLKTGDSGAKGTAVVVRSGQSDYLKVGTALSNGFNAIVQVALNVEYVKAETIMPVVIDKLVDLTDVYGAPSVNGSFYKWDTSDNRFQMRNDWDDLRIVPSAFDFAGVGDPSLENWQPGGSGATFKVWVFQSGEEAFFTIQLPHGYAQGEDIYCHVHWTPHSRGVAENGRTVAWKLDYSWANINGVFGASANIDMTDTCDGVDHKHLMTPDIIISGVDKHISSMLVCRIYRDAGDTWAGTTAAQSPAILEIDFHVPMDTQGSETHSLK